MKNEIALNLKAKKYILYNENHLVLMKKKIDHFTRHTRIVAILLRKYNFICIYLACLNTSVPSFLK